MTNEPAMSGLPDGGAPGREMSPSELESAAHPHRTRGAQPAEGAATMRAAAERARRKLPQVDLYRRLSALVGALDAATARLQEAHEADEILAIVGTALRAFDIGCQVALLDTPLEGSGDAAVAAMASNTLRINYVSILPGLRSTIERLIGRSIARFPIPLAQVSIFKEAVRTHQPVYLPDTSDVAGEALPWLAAPLRRRLLRLIHASSCIIAPLLSRGRVLGIMGMWAGDLLPGDAAALGAFARQTGIALDNTRLFRQLERERTLLETVIHTDPSAIAIVTGADNIVGLANPHLRALSPHPEVDPLGHPLDEIFPPELLSQGSGRGAGLAATLARVRRTRQPATIRGVLLRPSSDAGSSEHAERTIALHAAPIRLPERVSPALPATPAPMEDASAESEDALLLTLWDMTDAVRSEERLRAQVRRSEALARAALALERERDLPALLARIAQAARDLTDADWAGFLLRTEPGERFEIAGVVGASMDQTTTLRQYAADLPVLQPLLTLGEPLLLADAPTATLGAQSRLFTRARVRALAGTALVARAGWIVGVLVVGHQRPARFSGEHTELLGALGAQAAAAIERAWALAAADHRADELEATFRSITAGVAIYDLHGDLLRMNDAGQHIARQHAVIGETAESRHERFRWRLPDGTSLPPELMPSLRAVRGEIFYGADYLVDGENGPETRISASGAPLRGSDGKIRGGVVVFRNVTAVYQLERRTHEALDALLRMAATLVEPLSPLPPGASVAEASGERLRAMLRDLCQLALGVLGCQRCMVDLIDPETLHDTPVAIVGLTLAEQEAWDIALVEGGAYVPNPHMGWLSPQARARLIAGQTAVLDFREPPYQGLPNPVGVEVALAAPMRIDDRTVGLLVLDHGAERPGVSAHQFTPQETELAMGVARLAALAVERQRLEVVVAENEVLRQANALKEEFLSIVSHELRTPLTVLQARTQATQKRLVRQGQSEAAEQFAPMRSALDRMNDLVQEMLDTANIQHGRMELHPEPANLGDLVRAVVEEEREFAGRTIVLEGDRGAGLEVEADLARLPQVLTNLLDNALKYSPLDAPVVVRVWRAAAPPSPRTGRRGQRPHTPAPRDEVLVSVGDEGVGIPPDELGQVFDRYYRARTSSARQYGGLGLGLYISHDIVARHHGRIWAESRGPGHGATFTLALPAREDAGEGHERAPGE